jgi:hypothetical protein
MGLPSGDFVRGNFLGDNTDQFFLDPPYHLRFGEAEPLGLFTNLRFPESLGPSGYSCSILRLVESSLSLW